MNESYSIEYTQDFIDLSSTFLAQYYCKYSFLQCPLLSFELVDADQKAWLEQKEGVQSTQLVVNASLPFT